MIEDGLLQVVKYDFETGFRYAEDESLVEFCSIHEGECHLIDRREPVDTDE